MQISLAKLLCNASEGLEVFYAEKDILNKFKFLDWINTFPAQLVVLAVQVIWTKTVEQALRSGKTESVKALGVQLGKFQTAEKLASKVVPFFSLCGKQLSRQTHYYFGLSALKEVLTSAGHLKRARLLAGEGNEASFDSDDQAEQEILIQSVTETIVPKLVAEDVPLLKRQVFFNF
ncbi:hypothetical protein BY996DRAFT_6420870 [Phakopsora pachyrhizi]|nr:hypothetical protein BY996DRAFT_6420870 [Phakopsora pachyrhizi]